MGGDEDHVDLAGERLRGLDAVHLRHADIEKDDVGLEAAHERNRLAPVRCLADDRELGPRLLQATDDLFAHQAFVVGDDGGGDGRGGHAAGSPDQIDGDVGAIS